MSGIGQSYLAFDTRADGDHLRNVGGARCDHDAVRVTVDDLHAAQCVQRGQVQYAANAEWCVRSTACMQPICVLYLLTYWLLPHVEY